MDIFNIFARKVCEVKVQDEHNCDDKTDKLQLNVLVTTHNTIMIFNDSCKYPLCNIVNGTIII